MTIMQRLGKQVLGLLGGLLLMLPAMATESVTYYHNDVAGTPMLATDAAGNLLWKETYLPYGKKQTNDPASVENRIGYAGKPYDTATGLSYMGARYYDPLTGRFTGVDPKGFDQANLQSFNRYAYANNNPYKFVDPDGRAGLAAVALTAVAIVGFTAIAETMPGLPGFQPAHPRDDGPEGFGISTPSPNVLTTPGFGAGSDVQIPIVMPGPICYVLDDSLVFGRRGLLLARDVFQELKRCK